MGGLNFITRTASGAAFLGLTGYACLEVAKNNIQTVAQLFEGSKISYFVKNPIAKTPMIDPLHGALCCALFVIIDVLATKIFEALDKDFRRNEFLTMARMTVSLLSTAHITVLLGVTSTWSAGIGMLAVASLVYAALMAVIKSCDANWNGNVPSQQQYYWARKPVSEAV